MACSSYVDGMNWLQRFRNAFLTLTFFLLASHFLFAFQSGDLQASIKRLKGLGAVFTTDDESKVVGLQFPEGSSFDHPDWHHIAHLTDLRDLDLGALYVGNDMLKHVGKLTELRTLNLFGNPLDSIALVDIEDLQKLETLYLYRTFIDDEGIRSIAKLKSLRRLNMFDTFLTDKGLELLGKCPQLEHLSIGNSKAGKFPESFFTPRGIQQLRNNLAETKITYWGSNQRIDAPTTIQDSDLKKPAVGVGTQLLNEKVRPAEDLSKRLQGTDWPCFLGPNQNGKSDETGIHTNWNRAPKLLWHKKVGTGYAAPTISKGRLLLYHRVPSPKQTHRFTECVSCLHSETGEEIWKIDFAANYEDLNGYGDGPRSTPLIDQDRVYVLSPAGVLRCLQLVDGAELWKIDLVHTFKAELPTYGLGASPVVYRDMVLVVLGAELESKASHTILAFDKTNGILRYGSGHHPAGYATPVLANTRGRSWCFVFHQDGLSVFNPETGKEDASISWKARIAGCANASCPVVDGSQVFISESYKLGGAMFRFGGDQLQSVWQDFPKQREKSMACHWNTPILHKGFLYGCSGRHRSDGELKCIEWATGITKWKMRLDGRASLTFVDGHFICQTESGLLTFFQATSSGYLEAGRIDKSNSTIIPSYPAWTAPVVAKGLMYLRGKQELICFDLQGEKSSEIVEDD